MHKRKERERESESKKEREGNSMDELLSMHGHYEILSAPQSQAAQIMCPPRVRGVADRLGWKFLVRGSEGQGYQCRLSVSQLFTRFILSCIHKRFICYEPKAPGEYTIIIICIWCTNNAQLYFYALVKKNGPSLLLLYCTYMDATAR